jgi:hypothetical protein
MRAMVLRMRSWRPQFEKRGPTDKSKGFEHARGALIEDGPPVPARLVAKVAGDPAFAEAHGSGYQQVLMTYNPTAICKMGHDTAVQATGCAKIKIFDAGILAQGGELEARGQLLAVAFCGFSVNKQAGALFKRQVIEGGCPNFWTRSPLTNPSANLAPPLGYAKHILPGNGRGL